MEIKCKNFHLYCKPFDSVIGTSLVTQMVKNLPAMQETWVQSLSWKVALEKGTATYSRYSGLENFMDCIVSQFMGLQRVGHN